MNVKPASPQPDLFENDEPQVVPPPAQKARLTTVVEALLLEIAAALVAAGEAGDDQDHR
jgi:hypothetical protein